jgi:uncharacterized protein with GYD domain
VAGAARIPKEAAITPGPVPVGVSQGEDAMVYYLVQLSYTAASWASQLADPQDRRDLVRPLFDQLGGRIEAAYFAFGPHDVVLIAELPDNRSAAALSLALTSGGAVQSIQTTPLLPIEEGIAAMRQAAAARPVYQPPLTEVLAAWVGFEEGP